jgi:hypothetical protein
VSRRLPHVWVLPIDDANRQLANGFLLDLEPTAGSRIKVLNPAGGWLKVLSRFESDHIADMDRYARWFMVLLVDFDEEEDRLDDARERIPERLRDRVFILGVWSEPEALKRKLGPYETIGRSLAKDCREATDTAGVTISSGTTPPKSNAFASKFELSCSNPTPACLSPKTSRTGTFGMCES